MALTSTANDTERFLQRPTITSRYLALISKSIFDAWSRYDEKAIPVHLYNVERRPADEHALKNKKIAIRYAAFRAISKYYYKDAALFADFIKTSGLDPSYKSLYPNTPEGIGNLAAKAVI